MAHQNWIKCIQQEINKLKNVELGELWKEKRKKIREKWLDREAEILWNFLADGNIKKSKNLLLS